LKDVEWLATYRNAVGGKRENTLSPEDDKPTLHASPQQQSLLFMSSHTPFLPITIKSVAEITFLAAIALKRLLADHRDHSLWLALYNRT
jgi:hypothetical protein